MSSYLVYHRGENPYDFKSDHEYEVGLCNTNHKFFETIKISTEKITDKPNQKRNIVTLNQIRRSELIPSTFHIFLITTKENVVFLSAIKVDQKDEEPYYNMVFQFTSDDIKENDTFRILLFYLPRLTKEIVIFSGSQNPVQFIEHYQTLNYQTNYKITASYKNPQLSVNFETDDQPIGKPIIFVVKIIGTNSIQLHQKTKSSFSIQLNQSLSHYHSIYLGVIDPLYPYFDANYKTPPIPILLPNSCFCPIEHINRMTHYKVRFGYDYLSGSIVFEFLLTVNDTRFDSIGIELSTKTGRCFKIGFGMITNEKPLFVRFKPLDIQQLGNFVDAYNRNELSIRFIRNTSNEQIKIPFSFIKPYQWLPEAKNALIFLRLYFELFALRPQYFKVSNSDSQGEYNFINRFVSDPSNFTIMDVVAYFSRIDGFLTDPPSQYDFVDKQLHNILAQNTIPRIVYQKDINDFNTNEGIILLKKELHSPIKKNSIYAVKNYIPYLIRLIKEKSAFIVCPPNSTENFLNSIGDDAASILYYRANENPEINPFDDYCTSRTEQNLLYHLNRPFMPLATYPEILACKQPEFGLTELSQGIVIDQKNFAYLLYNENEEEDKFELVQPNIPENTNLKCATYFDKAIRQSVLDISKDFVAVPNKKRKQKTYVKEYDDLFEEEEEDEAESDGQNSTNVPDDSKSQTENDDMPNRQPSESDGGAETGINQPPTEIPQGDETTAKQQPNESPQGDETTTKQQPNESGDDESMPNQTTEQDQETEDSDYSDDLCF